MSDKPAGLRTFISSAILIGFAGVSAFAQQPQPQSSAPTIQVFPTETIVDVSVTDSAGNPVHGLKQSDFTVEEDGHPRAIRSFSEFSNPANVPPQPIQLSAGTYTNRQQPSAPGALNIVLLDTLNPTALTGTPDFLIQTRVREAAESYLKTLPSGTRVAVLQLSSTHLRILQNFTSDRDLLSAAVHAMALDTKMQGSSEMNQSSGMSADSVASVTAGRGSITRYLSDDAVKAATMDQRCRATLEALKQIAASFASIKGKKNLIWFTRGIAEIDDPNMSKAFWNGLLSDYLPDYHKTLTLLQAAQITVYPISALMLFPDPVLPPIGGGETGADNVSLQNLAQLTGGIAYFNTNDLTSSLRQAVQAGADYYTLSYSPPDTKFDGRHHAITIHTDIPAAHLSYRDGYYAEDPRQIAPTPAMAFTAAAPIPVLSGDAGPSSSQARSTSPKLTAPFNSAMGRGSPAYTQLFFDVHVELNTAPPQPSDPPVFGTLAPRFQKKRLTRYAFSFSIDPQQLGLFTGSDLAYHGAIDFAVAAYDAQDAQITARSQTLNLQLNPIDYDQLLEKGAFSFIEQLDLPRDQQLFLRVGVRDQVSGKIGAFDIPLAVPKEAPEPTPRGAKTVAQPASAP